MPSIQIPSVGELWKNEDFNSHGIVAETQGTRVTFVSVTGVRVPIEFNRPGPMGRVPWTRVRSAPTYVQACSREGCSGTAVVQYKRPYKHILEGACPIHIPRGIQTTLLAEPNEEIQPSPTPDDPCPVCRRPGVEVFGLTRRLQVRMHRGRPKTFVLHCPTCQQWWFYDWLPSHLVSASTLLDIPTEFSANGHTLTPLEKEAVSVLRVKLRPRPSLKLKGIEPLTIYDVLRHVDL